MHGLVVNTVQGIGNTSTKLHQIQVSNMPVSTLPVMFGLAVTTVEGIGSASTKLQVSSSQVSPLYVPCVVQM